MKYFIAFLLMLLCAGMGYFVYFSYLSHQEMRKEMSELKRHMQEKSREETEAVSQLQKTHIEEFKKDFESTFKDYKEYTNLWREIIKPENFSTVEYAKENYELFKNDIEPTIRKKANKLLRVFPDYNSKLKAIVSEDSTDAEKRFMAEWAEMHDTHLNRMIDLLSKDEELLQAYGELIEFYYTHSKLYNVDSKSEEFIFKRDVDEKKHETLLKTIREIRRNKAIMRQKSQ